MGGRTHMSKLTVDFANAPKTNVRDTTMSSMSFALRPIYCNNTQVYYTQGEERPR